MSVLENWIQTPVAAALGWTLVHSLWEGGLAALVLVAALRVLRSSRARYAAGCLAMLGLLAAFGFTFTRLMLQQPMPGARLARPIPPAPEGGETWRVGPSRAPRDAAQYLPWLAPFWIAGVLLFHVRSLASWMAARRLRRTGVCCAPELWQRRLDRLSARLRLSRPVTLLESCLAGVPVVIGYLRPVILMPVGLLAGLPAGQIEAILLHELAHVRRYDYLVNLLQIFVEGLLFHHPAVWWISGVIRAERENCCDDLVVAVKGGAYEYAAALAALEQHREAVRETALAATGGSLMKRIRRLLPQPLDQPEAPRAALAPVFSAAILTITVAAAMTAWPSKPAERGPAPLHVGAASANPVTPAAQLPARVPASTQLAQAPVPQPRLAQVQPAPVADPPDSPYDKWLKQDVAYIVTDEERSAFKRLQTDEEREKFIEQFWLRRDPTPGTVENEFKEEYYRRIGYANEHFSASVAGWKTDRGRIYLTYGPPDEKEIHPAGSGGAAPAFPSEQWLYHYLEGIGNNIIIEFVDPAMSGDFRMTSDPSGAATLFYVPGAAGYQARIADLSRERANLLKSLTPEHPRVKRLDAQIAELQSGMDRARHNEEEAAVKTGATVQVMGATAALISVPLKAYGDHRVHLFARIVTKDRRPAPAFEDTIQGPAPIYTKFIAVRPGSYRVELTIRDFTTGQVKNDAIEFEVK